MFPARLLALALWHKMVDAATSSVTKSGVGDALLFGDQTFMQTECIDCITVTFGESIEVVQRIQRLETRPPRSEGRQALNRRFAGRCADGSDTTEGVGESVTPCGVPSPACMAVDAETTVAAAGILFLLAVRLSEGEGLTAGEDGATDASDMTASALAELAPTDF